MGKSKKKAAKFSNLLGKKYVEVLRGGTWFSKTGGWIFFIFLGI